MEFFEAVKARRSIRRYKDTLIPDEVVSKAIDAALLAPNSSNMQTWEFYWVKSPEAKKELAHYCLDQGAARTAQHMLVVVAAPKLWPKTRKEMVKRIQEAKSTPPIVLQYYDKLIPFTYGAQWLAPLKWLIYNITGIFRPMSRRPWSFRDLQEVSIKSAALACENFMLAISAQGFDTCPMEGFDECRVKKMLKLKWSDRVVMVISVGERDLKGLWGDQVRFPREWFVKEV